MESCGVFACLIETEIAECRLALKEATTTVKLSFNEEVPMMPLRRNADSNGCLTVLEPDLDEVLDTIVEHRRERRQEDEIPPQTNTRELRFWVGNDCSQARSVVSTLQDVGLEWGVFTVRESFRVAVALEEALSNAIIHGNLEMSSNLREGDDGTYEKLIAWRLNQVPYRSRRVEVVAKFTACEAVFVIRDEGPGFDTAQRTDPTDLENLSRPFGRGLLLMREMVDEVRYNARGNQVTLIKRKQPVETIEPF